MRTYSVSMLFTVTAALTTGFPLAVEAATFNYDQLQLIKTRPVESNNFLSFFGNPNDNQGLAAFVNLDPNAPAFGHTEISLNSPGNPSPYYGVGRNSSPEESGATRTATLTELNFGGFSNFVNYLTNNGISADSIGLSYGLKTGKKFTEAWNLGDDLFGEDWLASPTSTVEERIYQAAPDAVEIFLSLNDEKIINFGYSPFYVVLDYGETTAIEDDIDIFLTDIVPAKKQTGLSLLGDGLANAFLKDVSLGGGGIQTISESFGVEEPPIVINNGFGIFNLPFPVSLRTAPLKSVPEPSSILGLLTIGSLGLTSILKKVKSK